MKSYTDLEQSRKLAKILPIESADGYWFKGFPSQPYMVYTKGTPNPGKHIPCWSLAALLNVLPTTIGNFFEKNALRLRMDKGENDFNIWYDNFDYGDVAEELDVKENNPVDACVEMILKLHEQKIL